MENITLRDLLTVDTHGGAILIEDESARKSFNLIPDRHTFFAKLFAEVEQNGIKIIKNEKSTPINLADFLRVLDNKRNSCVVFIDGFAGCGKSTLVQHILSKQLKTYEYSYSFYNYNLEAQNDILIRDESGTIVRKSSIFAAIRKSFCEEFVKIAMSNMDVIDCFYNLALKCKDFQLFNDIYYDFANTNTFDEIMDSVHHGINSNNIKAVERKLFNQSEKLTSSICLLALDYILRISMYINYLQNKLYICYDNLDAIEDAEDLNQFDDILSDFRVILDRYLSFLQNNNYFKERAVPHFIMLATYRKITASMVNIADTVYREVHNDESAKPNADDSIFYIDATSAFSYRKIVARRKQYFAEYFQNMPLISDDKKKEILNQFEGWNTLNQNLEIMNNRYSSLWNRNYRTCSLIANELFSVTKYEFNKCVNFVVKYKKSKVANFTYKKIDGYDSVKADDGSKVLCTYYGGSAILLSSICKIFNEKRIWSDFLNLTPLNTTDNSYKYVSLSRFILTYIYNAKGEVSLETLYREFSSKGLFSVNELCSCLANMLARNPRGIWRRPIYYSRECILSNSTDYIKNTLLDQCDNIKNRNHATVHYAFLLCDSGRAYVESLMQEFEFFSNRLSNANKALYLYDNKDDIEAVIDMVYNAVNNCCKNMLKFMDRYICLNSIKQREYLSLPIHPTTNRKFPQLHTERTIFSHIAYLNNVRLYYLEKSVVPDLNTRKMYNELFVEYIWKYLNLYYINIKPICDQRVNIADRLKTIISSIRRAIINGSTDTSILFESISLNENK